MNTNWIGGTRDREDRPEHPTQHDPRDRGQSDEPPAEYWEAREQAAAETVTETDMTAPHDEEKQ